MNDTGIAQDHRMPRPTSRLVILFSALLLLLAGITASGALAADEEATPLAGEAFHTEVLGEPVTVPPRDRKKVIAASFGVAVLPEGPQFYQVLPFGALYLWRNSDDMRQRFRTTLSGPVNDVPTDTYEGRVHARLRKDALERNLMELPHRGYTFGGDFYYGHRANWNDWGGGPFGVSSGQEGRQYLMGSVFAVSATPVPFIDSEKHRLVTSLYGGIGEHLDRFSTFRLPGRPTGYAWEAIALPMLPSVAFNELFPSRYGIAHLEYRYEPIFFMYPMSGDRGGSSNKLASIRTGASATSWNRCRQLAGA